MIYLILYIKIGLILLLLFTIMMGVTGEDVSLQDIFAVVILWPLVIYYMVTRDF
jgi:hypothetical protein